MTGKMTRSLALKILDINDPITSDKIRTAYKEKAKLLHPDKNKDADSTEKMQLLNEARQFLLSECEDYVSYSGSTFRNEQEYQTFDPSLWDSEEYIKSFFGITYFDIYYYFGASHRVLGKPGPSSPCIKHLEVTYGNIYRRYTIHIPFKHSIICPRCDGLGTNDRSSVSKKCRYCNGCVTIGTFNFCSLCAGIGRDIPFNKLCLNCRGAGIVYVQDTLSFIPTEELFTNALVLFRSRGDEYPGKGSSDVCLIVNIMNDPHFIYRDGSLHYKVVLSRLEFLEGTKFLMYLPDGNKLPIKVSKENISLDKRIRIPNYGFYDGDKRADLYVLLVNGTPDPIYETYRTLKFICNSLLIRNAVEYR